MMLMIDEQTDLNIHTHTCEARSCERLKLRSKMKIYIFIKNLTLCDMKIIVNFEV